MGIDEKTPEIPDEEFITSREVCKMLSISVATLKTWRKRGKITTYYPDGIPEPGTPAVRIIIRFNKREILNIMESGKVRYAR